MPSPYRPLEKNENEGKLRRAARKGDTAAYDRLKEAKRTNGADDKAYRQAQEQQSQTSPSSSKTKKSPPSTSSNTLSAKEERELRKRINNGDKEAFDTLSRAGRVNYFDRQRFKNAQKKEQGAQPSATPPKRPAPKKPKEESWITRIIESSPSRVPDEKREWVAEKAKHTVRDLTRRGVSRKTAEQVAQEYVEEYGWRRLPEAERKWIEKHGGGIGY